MQTTTDFAVKDILSGSFSKKNNAKDLQDRKKNKLVFIASSTFTDTKEERDILINEVIPTIRAKAQKDNIQVILFDMR